MSRLLNDMCVYTKQNFVTVGKANQFNYLVLVFIKTDLSVAEITNEEVDSVIFES